MGGVSISTVNVILYSSTRVSPPGQRTPTAAGPIDAAEPIDG